MDLDQAGLLRWVSLLVSAPGVTLRQLFYRLVAAQIIPNTQAAYKTLSNKTAKARREGAG